jgi:hypothetical protein
MAVSKQEVILEFNADTGKAEKNFKGLQDGIQDTADSVGNVAEQTELIAKNAGKAGGLFKKLGKIGAQGFKMVGTAIAATGLIGLVTKVLQPIIEAFLENKTVAEALEVAMAGLGAVINGIVAIGEKVVKVMVAAFQNPQEAIAKLRQRLIDVGDYMKTLLKASINPIQRGFLNVKRAALQAAVGAKEFLGLDATELKKSIREIDDQLSDLVVQQEENKDKLKEPFEKAAEAVRNFVKETVSAVEGATKLQKAMQNLEERERKLSVETARQTAAIEELKRQRDDERLSIEKRIKFAQEAAAIDQRIADENAAIQEEKARLLRQEIALQGETKERVQALADAEIAALDARRASAAVQTELQESIFALNEELRIKEEEAAQAELDALLERLQKEKEAKDKAAEEDLARAEKLAEEEARLEEAKRQVRDQSLAALAALNDAFGGADVERAERIANLEDAISEAQDEREKQRLIAQRDNLAKIQDEEGRKQFERSKKIQAAQALISTYESAVQAFKSLAGIPVVGPSLGAAAAAAAVASGLANVKNIQSQTFTGSASAADVPNTESITSAAAGEGAASTAPQLDLSFLGQGAQQVAPVQAYVLAENVSNAQQANQKIQDQATL